MGTLEKYIKEQLQSGKSVPGIIAELKQAGHSDSDIDTAFKAAMEGSREAEKPAAEKKSGLDLHHLDATKTFVAIGLILIVTAVIIVLASQWSNVGPLARVSFVLIPMLILFGISGALAGNRQYADIQEATLATGALIFPFALGTALYQFKIIAELNTLLFMVSALAGYLLFTILEFLFQRHRFSLLTLLGLYSFVIALFLHVELQPLSILWLLFFVSLAVTALGFTLMRQTMANAHAYTVTGTLFSAVLLPISTIYSLNQETSLPLETNAMLIAAFGIVYLGLAGVFYGFYERMQHKILYDLKRAFEEVAPLLVIIPFLAIGFENIGYMLVAVILSFIAIFASIPVRIRSLLPAGALGLIIGILAITGKYFVDSLGWPIVVFLSGFAMIGISFFVRRINQMQKERQAKPLFFGLGEDPTVSPVKAGEEKRGQFSCLRVLLLLILVFVLLPWLIQLFFRGFLF